MSLPYRLLALFAALGAAMHPELTVAGAMHDREAEAVDSPTMELPALPPNGLLIAGAPTVPFRLSAGSIGRAAVPIYTVQHPDGELGVAPGQHGQTPTTFNTFVYDRRLPGNLN